MAEFEPRQEVMKFLEKLLAEGDVRVVEGFSLGLDEVREHITNGTELGRELYRTLEYLYEVKCLVSGKPFKRRY